MCIWSTNNVWYSQIEIKILVLVGEMNTCTTEKIFKGDNSSEQIIS